VRALPLLLVIALAGCTSLFEPPLSESEAGLRVRRALRDLEGAGFELPQDFRLDWHDVSVRCKPGHVCVSPLYEGDAGGILIIAPEVLQSDDRLRLSLLEVWQRLLDGGPMQGPRAFARSTLRQLVSGGRVGVSDPILLGEVLDAYSDYLSEVPTDERAGLPDPATYSHELGLFLVPVSLLQPGDFETPSLAPQGLGSVTLDVCAKAARHVHPGVGGWEGRREYWNAMCADEQADLPAAVLHLIAAERLLPHDPRVPLALGDALCRARASWVGILAFERAAAKSPGPAGRADALRGIGRCHLQEGDYAEARTAYRHALALDPDDVVTGDWIRWLEEQGLVPALP
jgi:hypothetical protein